MKNSLLFSFFKNIDFSFPKMSYIHLAYFATMATGFASLCAQVAWQKYLTILVGSDTRSINLVIAVFLLGLAVGYYVFGKITEKAWSRFILLKIYGWIELITAIYIAVFYIYFNFLKNISFNTPSNLFIDILIALMALFLPTFLMGASIPILTAVLPKSSKEINSCHFKIYGWNIFGAFLGVLFSGFYFLPKFGLALTLVIASAINIIAALIFIGNKLEGGLRRQTEYVLIPSRIPNWFYIFFSFLAGAIIISFEVLFIRVLHLSIGAGVFNFPIILSIFVGGLAWGSLSINSKKVSPSFFIKQTLITAFLLGLLYIFSPYWSIWISHIRVSLFSIPSNYFVFKFLIYLFVSIFLLPAVFFMGRLLPLSYALLKKTKENYGAVCGYLYFFNTLGTVLGTIILAYLAFYIFDLDELFKINILLLISLAFISALYEKRIFSTALACFLAVALLFLPNWNRTGHYLGYFRTINLQDYHFKKIFSIPKKHKEKEKLLFFEDGPNASISLVAFPKDTDSSNNKKLFPSAKHQSVSFIVNGKAIGNSLGDFSTVFLLSSLAYLYAPKRDRLSSAVIGLGMGTSAGILAQLEEMEDTTVLEIAPEVVDNVRRSPEFSFGLLDNPKAKVIAQDGLSGITGCS
ncbi:MAG: fused MFS/spermidine synthase [Bdellovibrionaceae bacterium]|nr:fused MFS/spermidine synthase [Pseudobdellovibrionaceae bacterium]